MEIIFDKNVCNCITGRLSCRSHWSIRARNGRYFGLYTGCRHPDIRREELRAFYDNLLTLQKAKYITQIILTDQERRILA